MYPDREVLLLDKITIYSSDKSHSVTLPRVRDIEVGAEEESKTVTMASGKTVAQEKLAELKKSYTEQ